VFGLRDNLTPSRKAAMLSATDRPTGDPDPFKLAPTVPQHLFIAWLL